MEPTTEKIQEDEPKQISKVDQYKELCSHARHNDNRLWIAPTAAYSLSILGFKGAYAATDPWFALLIALAVLLVFAAFTLQFARYLAYLAKNHDEILELEKKSPHVVPVTHLSGLQSFPEAERWFVKVAAKTSSGTVMFYAMLVTWVAFAVMTILIVVDQ